MWVINCKLLQSILNSFTGDVDIISKINYLSVISKLNPEVGGEQFLKTYAHHPAELPQS